MNMENEVKKTEDEVKETKRHVKYFFKTKMCLS